MASWFVTVNIRAMRWGFRKSIPVSAIIILISPPVVSVFPTTYITTHSVKTVPPFVTIPVPMI
jgi:hypothetical protein